MFFSKTTIKLQKLKTKLPVQVAGNFLVQYAAGVHPPDAALYGVEEHLGVVHQPVVVEVLHHVGDEHHLRQAEHVHQLPQVVLAPLLVRLVQDVLGDVPPALEQLGHFVGAQLPQSCGGLCKLQLK